MSTRIKKKKVTKRDLFIRAMSIFLAVLIVGGTLISLVNMA